MHEFENYQKNLDSAEQKNKQLPKRYEEEERLMTEEDEMLFRQVASAINEKAFFGKKMRQ